jgi:predicted transcriptional regulator
MKAWNIYKKELLSNPEVAREYAALEPEFELARSIIQARIDAQMSQIELAEKAGVGQSVIARLESGTTNPTVGTVNRVARALGKEYKLVAK